MLFFFTEGFSQKHIKNPYKTGNINLEDENWDKEHRKFVKKNIKKKYKVILKSNIKGLLYGNPCATEQTRKMGFEYAVQGQGNYPGKVKVPFIQNFKTYSKLILTHSPFWKIILNKRIKKCREKMGDIVG